MSKQQRVAIRKCIVSGLVGGLLCLLIGNAADGVQPTSIESPSTRRFDFYEVTLEAGDLTRLCPWTDIEAIVTFTLPDGTERTVDAFYDGAERFKARAYMCQIGHWLWQSHSALGALDGQTGSFEVVPSDLKGKLRKHPQDPQQFARDNGEWFLHIGDTGYRYVTATEPHWKAYIDQAADIGVTKVRTWFCQGRSDVQVLFNDTRSGLNLTYWQEIDRRLVYALNAHPDIVFQLIPYGEDTEELLRYPEDRISQLVARYAQARFSSFPNVTWCISNDREIVPEGTPLKGRRVPAHVIERIGHDMAAREPWGTLLTNHQSRFSGYAFVDASWSDIVTVEDLDQVSGEVLLQYRSKVDDPVVDDEDRYELYRSPKDPRYYFRRLMWASLFSGGHATYGGLKTYEPWDGELRGIQGYLDAVSSGKLVGGAADFCQIHRFFREAGLTLVGMTPMDGAVGNTPSRLKCIGNKTTFLVYLANPNGDKAERAQPGKTPPSVKLGLARGLYQGRWFNPLSGEWSSAGEVKPNGTLTAPGPGDWVLVVKRD